MKKIFVIFFLSIFATSSFASSVSDKTIARVIAHTYIISNPLLSTQDFVDYINQNKAFFARGSLGIRRIQALGARLTNTGLAAYDPQAYERAMGAGPAELAPEVANSINSGATDLVAIGQELLWLANVLPSAVNGNYTPFLTTGTPTRRQIRQMAPIMNMMLQLDPEIAQVVQQTMNQFLPIVEEQVFMLLMMLGE